jgi:hypothetical protein
MDCPEEHRLTLFRCFSFERGFLILSQLWLLPGRLFFNVSVDIVPARNYLMYLTINFGRSTDTHPATMGVGFDMAASSPTGSGTAYQTIHAASSSVALVTVFQLPTAQPAPVAAKKY